MVYFSQFHEMTVEIFLRSDKNDLADAILKVVVRAVTVLIDDGLTLFFQYFYFEMYNDIEIAKQLTNMALSLTFSVELELTNIKNFQKTQT